MSHDATAPSPQVHAVKLTPAAELAVKKQQHPWIFDDSLQRNVVGQAGDVCVLFGCRNNRVYGVGLLDPFSEIKIKMLHYGGGAQLDRAFFEERIAKAFSHRVPLFETRTTSYRLLFGENDGFPSFIADVYNQVLVIKLYSAIWFPYLWVLAELLVEKSRCKTVVLRLSRTVRPYSPLPDGTVLQGTLENEEVSFLEWGLPFKANVLKGHKTGYFLDHRHNRRRVSNLSQGKSVLDVFCYAGAFSVHALAGGAREVTGVDVSAQALDVATENVKASGFRGDFHTICGDAFEVLKQLNEQGKSYDLVIIDPPSFAKRAAEVPVALRKYAHLAKLGARLTKSGGMLLVASCSSRVKPRDFFGSVERGLAGSGRRYQLMDTTGHDIDHPVGFAEGEYLKCGYYKIG